MTLPTGSQRDFDHAKLLLEEYSFDLCGFEAEELVIIWRDHLEAELSWIRSAILEALYQGRYKAFSVEQILQAWKRRGHPVRHFNSEFERIVFGPIDPTVSKYAPMTSLSPSELMTPQSPPCAAEHTEPEATQPPLAIPEDEIAEPSPPNGEPLDGSAPSAIGPSTEAAKTPPEETLPDKHVPISDLYDQPEPIQKFVPQPEMSGFYERLQSVAREFR